MKALKPMMLLKYVLLMACLPFSFIQASEPQDQAPPFQIRNLAQIAQLTGIVNQYKIRYPLRRKIKIAVLDYGFQGWEKELALTIPESTFYFPGSKGEAVPSPHGLNMAQILTAVLSNNMKIADAVPELYLFEVSGYTNFKAAIDQVIDLKVDIVLHSVVREYGSNFDGYGFFNEQVDRAARAGVLWVNAAGNFAKTTFNKKAFATNADGWVQLPGPNQSLPIRCAPIAQVPVCKIRLVLSWNDFKDNTEEGTDKDLDLVLTDDTLNIIQGSYLVQTTKTPAPKDHSLYPREIVEAVVKPGRYFVRIKNRSNNFTQEDSLRVTGDGEFLSFEHFDQRENLLPPADNPLVITVGAYDSEMSSVSFNLNKPDVFAPSVIQLSDGRIVAGSSNAAAIVAAGLATLLQDYDIKKQADAVHYLLSSEDRPQFKLKIVQPISPNRIMYLGN